MNRRRRFVFSVQKVANDRELTAVPFGDAWQASAPFRAFLKPVQYQAEQFHHFCLNEHFAKSLGPLVVDDRACDTTFLGRGSRRGIIVQFGHRQDAEMTTPIVRVPQTPIRCRDHRAVRPVVPFSRRTITMGVTCWSILGPTDTLMIPLRQQSHFMAEPDRGLRGQSCQHHPFAPTHALWPHLAAAGVG